MKSLSIGNTQAEVKWRFVERYTTSKTPWKQQGNISRPQAGQAKMDVRFLDLILLEERKTVKDNGGS